MRRQKSFPGSEPLGLLLDAQILFKVDQARGALRPGEGDDSLILWDFHDLLFHARSTQGRHANPLGGLHPYVDVIAPLPAERPRWPGKKIDLRKISDQRAISQFGKLLRERHSIRSFDQRRPIALAELARFLDSSARVHARFKARLDGEQGPELTYAARPYPSAGAAWELELYLAVEHCEGLKRGFYHYDAGAHALVPITVAAEQLEMLVSEAQFAMAAPTAPQVLIMIAARFGRMSWKYSSIAYALMLKDVGVLTQTFYLMATEMGLGGCAIGTANIDLFAKMTGIAFHVEGPLGQFAIGRPQSLP
jgi:SagB-type dehydrogenase family enzyme